jgi:hypothetical protein
MQTIYDLEKKDVHNLTFEQVERFVDIACAMDGVMLLPELPVEPKLDNPPKDAWIFKVGEFKVRTAEDAAKILEVVSSVGLVETTYDYHVGYNNTYIVAGKTVNPPEIKKESVYSAEMYAKVKSDLQKFNAAKTEYDSKRKDYDKASTDRSKISSKIWEYVNDVNFEFGQKERLTNEFARYLDLAGGDKAIALSFFDSAFKKELDDMQDYEEFIKTLE